MRIDELELGEHRVGKEYVLLEVEIPHNCVMGECMRRGHNQENGRKQGRTGFSSFKLHLHQDKRRGAAR